ncbi:DNA integrity scanning protein DisA nucleotide-binding domain protein [Bacillus toyonensis]|uniref:DNA integrity scanning protein DisA nucleotide-binding domain protein n=1 Tax=Bacillus toyonensis TaxID=155322 RepID=UPI0001A0F7D9|nr:diadenylate cyclase [Bacillus toyonensis]EEL60381.1 Transcriptional regulator, XRE [Bacillus cereus Rock4-18]
MYIWGYQPHFQVSLNTTAKEIFNNVKSDLNPKVWVVGVWDENNEMENPNSVIITDTPFESELFSKVNDIAKDIYCNDPDRQKLISNEIAERKYHHRLKLKAKVNAMNKVLDEAYEEQKLSFHISMPKNIYGYWVFVILQLNKESVESIPTLNDTKALERFPIMRSLTEATIFEFLRSCSNALQIPDVGEELYVLGRNGSEFIRSGGETFLRTLAIKFHGDVNLFEMFNLISSQYYEGGESNGKIIISNNDHPAINQTLKFSSPIDLSNHKAIRKLLEMTNGDISLLANGNEVYGMGNILDHDSVDENLFIINFKRHFMWELSCRDSVLMVVEYREPRLPKERMEKGLFSDHLIRTFSRINENDIDLIWDAILAATEQKHGTMVVITNKAAEEADRLNGQCINIEPINLTAEVMRLVTAIDGAVLLDPNGKCHALGVILDGLATDKGDSARGARYNSALRYIDSQDNECLIVVVSEDGDINLIPHLKPKIPRQWIDMLIAELQQVNESERLDIKSFNRIMHDLKSLVFYLLEEDCNKINELRVTIESKMDEMIIRVVYPDLTPNPEMNSSYYE